MRVLVVGSGGREHALVWKLSQTCEVIAAPGNPGIAQHAECFEVGSEDGAGLANLCSKHAVDLVVFGPEAPLIAGLAQGLRLKGFNVFGPDAGPSQLEGSKAFSKELMAAAGVPTAKFGIFHEVEPAMGLVGALFNEGSGAVIKASGAALGKGVVVCESPAEAESALRSMLHQKTFGVAGETVVVEEKIDGREFSLLTICSDGGIWSLPVAQDHKRALNGDQGPNTGGMGAVSPVSWITDSLVRETEATVVQPILESMRSRGYSYRGVLFSGLMVSKGKPYCLEYNVRFGDPETQAVMPRLGRGFSEALFAAAEGHPINPIEILDHASVSVVLASEGYPGTYTKGKRIDIGRLPQQCFVFHAGTTISNGELVSAGGRVLAVSGLGPTVEEARRVAYEGVGQVHFEGKYCRTDIGLSPVSV